MHNLAVLASYEALIFFCLSFLDPPERRAGRINPGEMSLALRFTNFTGHRMAASSTGRIFRIIWIFFFLAQICV
jgi:hypothetical protein